MEETAALKLAVVLIGFCMLIHHCQAVQYAIGDATGWMPGTLNYNQWAAKNTYKVGDTLLFVYTAGDHTVVQVTKADHDSCTITIPNFLSKTLIFSLRKLPA